MYNYIQLLEFKIIFQKFKDNLDLKKGIFQNKDE